MGRIAFMARTRPAQRALFTMISICLRVSEICVAVFFVDDLLESCNFVIVQAQLATSLTILGAWIGCILGNAPSESRGRRYTLLWNNVFFLVGALLCSVGDIYSLFSGRFIAGLAMHCTVAFMV